MTMETHDGQQDEIFQIKARKCRRCGGILTRKEGLRDGYGPCCLRKMQEEEAEKEQLKDQISLFQEEESDHETAAEAAGADDGAAVPGAPAG